VQRHRRPTRCKAPLSSASLSPRQGCPCPLA
jgi:hypothetical protein